VLPFYTITPSLSTEETLEIKVSTNVCITNDVVRGTMDETSIVWASVKAKMEVMV
jgi:hypothetical protein